MPPRDEMEVRQLAKHPHQYLEEVEISGHYGWAYYLELVMYFLENGVALKKLVIDPIDHVIGRSKEIDFVDEFEDDEEKENRTRRQVQRHLKPITPAGVELVIL